MGTTTAIGSDGSATFPADGYTAKLNTWAATLTRATSVVTGFGDTGQRRVASSVLDITGSAGGVPIYNASTASPVDGIVANSQMTDLTLFWNGSASSADECSLKFDAVCSSVALGSTLDGDSTVTFNFEVAETTAPVFTWYEA